MREGGKRVGHITSVNMAAPNFYSMKGQGDEASMEFCSPIRLTQFLKSLSI